MKMKEWKKEEKSRVEQVVIDNEDEAEQGRVHGVCYHGLAD